MQAVRYIANAMIALLCTATVAANEVLVVEELNLRQKELNKIVDIARGSLEKDRKVLNVSAYKILGGGKREALVTYEPWNINERSFEAAEVLCQKRTRSWACEKPIRNRYYYELTLSNSIALGKGVTASVAQELLIAARGSSGAVGHRIDGRYLRLGGYSHITRNSENEYAIYGWCDCVLERTTEGFIVTRHVDAI